MCYGFIYDTIVNPYHLTHSLRNAVSLTNEEADRISQTFLEVISEFQDIFFFEEIDRDLTPDQCDEWTWIRFEEENPDGHNKIEREVERTLESMKLKKKQVTDNLVTRFFMNKLKVLMVNLPQIHLDHSLKIFKKECSPGPLPYKTLVEIRKKAGLPFPEYKENFEDLYS
jgi:hypothetical protein